MKIFGLIGKTLGHSFSKKYFTEKFNRENIHGCRYENFEIQNPEKEIAALKQNRSVSGLNVTIPYKTAILPFLDFKSEACTRINACNCIKVENGKWLGFNTDVYGFEKTFLPSRQEWHKKALVLGTGGAAAAVTYVLQNHDIPFLSVSRRLAESPSVIRYDDITAELIREYNIVINTTPLGMFPNVDEFPELPYEAVSEKNYFYDLIYNPEKTRFLQKAAQKGAIVVNGADMLVLQAEESWKIWNA